MPFTQFHNPYDFANPVSDHNLFIGREKELDEIIYYLRHAASAPRPINIAFIGQRASGKTSLLNMTEREAQKLDLCTVRIDLDEDDGKFQLTFFHKLFDGILTAVCARGAFGGLYGTTYATYIDITNACIIPEDKLFCPFIFPIQYAKAISCNNLSAPVLEPIFKNDLHIMYKELKRPIVILFDEGNVLTHSRVHLQKLRNIFMNIQGFMIVITGTPELFPVINDVFSPIIRQFKKIEVASFQAAQETQKCIIKPLQALGISPEDVINTDAYSKDIQEIHQISGGRPYEIQLICHKLFRRIQSRRAKRMTLDLSLLEDVRKELEISNDLSRRPTLIKIQNLKRRQLSSLNFLCSCDGHATYEQLLDIQYIMQGTTGKNEDDLNKDYEYFLANAILTVENGVIRFNGDDFDKLYVKYYSREQGVNFNIYDMPLPVYCDMKILKHMNRMKLEPVLGILGADVDLVKVIGELDTNGSDRDIVSERHLAALALYKIMIEYKDNSIIPILRVKIESPWFKLQVWYYYRNPSESHGVKDRVIENAVLANRARERGWNIEVDKVDVDVIPLDRLSAKFVKSDNDYVKKEIAEYHAMMMVREYLGESNLDISLFHGNLAFKLSEFLEGGSLNNIGYLFLRAGENDKSKLMLERACNEESDPPTHALSEYNLAILEAKSGQYAEAEARLKSCMKLIDRVDERSRTFACVILPRVVEGKLVFEEIKDPDLLVVANAAQDAITLAVNREKEIAID